MLGENHILKQALGLAHDKIIDLELTISELREEVRKVEEVSEERLAIIKGEGVRPPIRKGKFMDDDYLLHVLRNPHGYDATEMRDVRLQAADRLEELIAVARDLRQCATIHIHNKGAGLEE